MTSAESRVVLFIDGCTLVGRAAPGAMDASNLLKPALARGALRGRHRSTSTEHVEKDAALERRSRCSWASPRSRTRSRS